MNETRRLFWAGFLILLGAVLNLHAPSGLSGAAERGSASAIHVHVEQGLLTIDVRDAPLSDVLRAIAKEAGIDVLIGGDVGARLTQSFKAVPLEEGIRRLLRRHSVALFYAPSPDHAGDQTLTAVWVTDSLTAEEIQKRTVLTDLSERKNRLEERKSRLQAIRKLARQRDKARISELIRLSQDADPFVRRQAVVALGRLGGPQAVATLKAALQDRSASIRIQALRGLRRLQGSRAAPTLGIMLLHDFDPRVRRMAARALGQLQSEAARWALEAAVTDPDYSVRRVVSAGLARYKTMR